MRILVTNNGIQKQAEIESDVKSNSKDLKDDSNRRSHTYNDSSNLSSSKKRKRDLRFRIETPIENIPKVKVNQKKMSIPKELLDHYNLEVDSSFDAVTERPSTKKPFEYNELKLSSIIKPATQRSLVKSIDIENKKYLNNFKFDDNCFRFIPKDKKVLLAKLERNLSEAIPSDNNELINYLKSKEKVSQQFVNKLAEVDMSRISQWNKICQLINRKSNDHTKLMQSKIRKTLKSIEEKTKNDYGIGLRFMDKDLSIAHEYLKKHDRKFEFNSRQMDILEEMKRDWSKMNIDRFYKPRTKCSVFHQRVYKQTDL